MPALATAAISAGAKAASSIINNTVNTLLEEKVRRAEVTKLEAEAERIRINQRLDQLSNQQKYELAMALQNSKNLNEQFAILQSTVAAIATEGVDSAGQILEAAVNAQSKNAMVTAIIIGASLLALIGTAFIVIKMKK